MAARKEVFCSGLYLSARWFVVSEASPAGVNVVILPDKDSAEYCSSDLYALVEGDRVFFLPDSGKSVERSNYKSSLGVQRTSAVGRILSSKDSGNDLLYIVTYPEALEELIPESTSISGAALTIRKGDEISHDSIVNVLVSQNFIRTDFVSAPGQFAVRGSIIDIFSYSDSNPYRISFFGDEVETVNVFDCNTQLSVEERDKAEIVPDIMAKELSENERGIYISDIFPENTVIWADSSDMYREKEFLPGWKDSGRFILTLHSPARVPARSSSILPPSRSSTRISNSYLPISGIRWREDTGSGYTGKRNPRWTG